MPLANDMDENDLIREQIAYYRARAREYDAWHQRLGRYDRGEEHRQRWTRELDLVREALTARAPFGAALELACGTGLWTRHLARGAASLTAIDVAPEVIEINRRTTRDAKVDYHVADIFEWTPDRRYDFVFFGFWLSHVPRSRFASFWHSLRRALTNSGRVFFVDSLPTQESTARDHAAIDHSGTVERRLDDGRTFHIVKRFYAPSDLRTDLARLGWASDMRTSGQFFLYGAAWNRAATGGACMPSR